MIANPMTARETFDAFYTRKLNALKIELNDTLKGDWSFVCGSEYACHTCQSRIFLHTMEGKIHCLRCEKPNLWPAELRTSVITILQRYPSLESSQCEWEALQSKPTPKERRSAARVRAGSTELGRKIRAARIEKGYSQVELGRMLVKKNGTRFTQSAIQNYECGEAKPSAHAMKQLQDILGLEVE